MGSSSASSRRIRSRASAKAPRPAAGPSPGRPRPPWGGGTGNSRSTAPRPRNGPAVQSRPSANAVSVGAPRPAARPSQGRPWPPWGAANAVSVGAPLHAPGDGRLFLEGLFHQGEDGVGALGQADGGRHTRLAGFLGGFLLILGGTGLVLLVLLDGRPEGGDGARELLHGDDAFRVVSVLADDLQDGLCVLAEHQHVGPGGGFEGDEHDGRTPVAGRRPSSPLNVL